MKSNNSIIYTNLAAVQARKAELQGEISKADKRIGGLWLSLVAAKRNSSKGELVGSIVSGGITAFDTFLLIRKLTRKYPNIFGKKKRKRR